MNKNTDLMKRIYKYNRAEHDPDGKEGYPLPVTTVKDLIEILLQLPMSSHIYFSGSEGYLYAWDDGSLTIDSESYLSI